MNLASVISPIKSIPDLPELQHILIVDDEPHIVNLIKMTLEDKYDVLEAYSGTQALELVKKTTPFELIGQNVSNASGMKV